jgi:hypothetical protein
MELSQNLVCNTGKWLNPHIPHDIHVHDNFTDAKIETTPPRPGAKPPKVDPKIVIEKTTLNETPQSLSPGAKAIADAAGLEPEFAGIKEKVVKPDLEIAPPSQSTDKKR